MGDLVFSQRQPQPLDIRLQDGHDHCGRRPESATRRDIGIRGHPEGNRTDAEIRHDPVVDSLVKVEVAVQGDPVRYGMERFLPDVGGHEPDPLTSFGDGAMRVQVYGGVQHQPAVDLAVRRDVRPAPREPQTERSFGADDHRLAARTSSTIRTTSPWYQVSETSPTTVVRAATPCVPRSSAFFHNSMQASANLSSPAQIIPSIP